MNSNSNSREIILARLRERLGRGSERGGERGKERDYESDYEPDNAAHQRAVIEDVVGAHLAGPPASSRTWSPDDLLKQFQEKAVALASTVDIVGAWTQIPAAVAQYLEKQDLPRQAVCWPEWAGLDWSSHGIAIEQRPARGDDRVGITGCFAAVAETGTLVLCSGKDTPAATSLLPETHIAIVAASRLVATMEDVWNLLRKGEGGRPGSEQGNDRVRKQWQLPRAVNFVSGPSRTGDIEQTIVLGAHGPYRVHIIVVQSHGMREDTQRC